MAEAFLKRYGSDRFEAHSAGLRPGDINPLTVAVMGELGYDLAGYRSKGLDEYLGKAFFQYLIIMCAQAEKDCPKLWPGICERLSWNVEDPAAYEGSEEEKLSKFREVRDQIEQLVTTWVAKNTGPQRAC